MKETKIQKYFAAALKDLLPKHFNSQTELALTAGVGNSTISEILKGKKTGRFDLHEKIATAFKKDPLEFYEIGKKLVEQNDKDMCVKEDMAKFEPCNKPIELTHDEIIRLFKDPETARNINRMLATLEHNEPSKYKQAETYIQALFDTLEVKKISNKNG
jgi:transcriptional regulator with XRE-family HTH domain